jgi:hypothetical protein
VLQAPGLQTRSFRARQGLQVDHGAVVELQCDNERPLPMTAAGPGRLPPLTDYRRALSVAPPHASRKGKTTRLARPLVDSYHTVWFPLHEELIGGYRLTRSEAPVASK